MFVGVHRQADYLSAKYSVVVWQALLLSLRWTGPSEEDQGSKVGIAAEARQGSARTRVHLCFQQAGEVTPEEIQIVSE